MKYELDEESVATVRRLLDEWHAAATILLRKRLKDATGAEEIAALESDLAFVDRRRDEVRATLDKAKKKEA